MLKSLRLLILFTYVIFSGCAEQKGLEFHVTEALKLRVKRDVDEYPDHRLYRFELERPVVVQGPGRALLLEFANRFTQLELGVTLGETSLLETTLDGEFASVSAAGFGGADSPETVSFSIPLEPGMRFGGFELLYRGMSDEGDDPLPLFAGFGDVTPGVIFNPSPVLDTRVRVSTHTGNPQAVLGFDISRLTRALDGVVKISLDYGYTHDPGSPGLVSLLARKGEDSVTFDVRLRDGGAALNLYEGMCGFVPEDIEIRITGDGFKLTSLTVGEMERDNGARLKPLPIDMGGVIGYSFDQWRTEDFELFSWNLYPEILIIDSISYLVQSDFFKRLAFFVEKAGSVGTLLSDESLAGRHGWNAHDYRAQDLARFFSTAATEAFPLGDRELLLRELLEENDIIRAAEGVWQPGEGGLISLSQEAPRRLRELFMVHEGYHGIFFSDIQYRDLSFSTWESLSILEQWFWREFLQLREYNAHDEYLAVNEFQAYLMQVPREKLDAYYWDYTVPGLVGAVPRTTTLVRDLRSNYPDTFHRSAEALETYLLESVGIGAADLFCLQIRE